MVLIVEDEKELCESLASHMSFANIPATMAYDAESALSFMEGQNFPLIITDMQLPDMGGLEMIQKAQDRTLTDNSTFFVMTGFCDHEEKSILKSGVAKLYLKPGDLAQMVDDAIQLIEKH